jgi:PTH1 family peptidyl-tRNA hydrolase
MLFRRTPQQSITELLLVVGLGNIGAQYRDTRHNVGFDVVDEVARRFGGHFRAGKFRGEDATVTIHGTRVLLLKPHTLMNLSGDAVAAASRFYRIPPQQILVICDDVYLPPGKLRIRARGGDGGHNGLWSIINRIGTQDFPRLRLGVGSPPPEMAMADYVLGRFLAGERLAVQEARDRAANVVETWAADGVEAAMNRWNSPDRPPKPKKPKPDEDEDEATGGDDAPE